MTAVAARASGAHTHPLPASARATATGRETERQLLCATTSRATSLRARSSSSASCRSRATSRCATRTPTSRSTICSRSPHLGLIKAIDRFEPDRGTKFTSYAAPTILGELKRHFRDKGWSLHVPRDLQERTLAVSRETEALRSGSAARRRSARSPTHSAAPSRRCSRHRRRPRATRRRRWTRRRRATTTSPLRWSTCSVTRTGPMTSSRIARGDRQHLEGAARCGAPGARAPLHARPDAAGDRRADRLLADARVAPVEARAHASRDGRSRRLSERAFSPRSPPSRC